MDGKYSKVLTIILILAIVLIIGILLFLGIRMVVDNNIKSDYESGADTFIETAKNKNDKNKENKNQNVVNEAVGNLIGLENLLVNNMNTNTIGESTNTKKQMYKGFPQVGVIEIPKTKLKCPILEDASKSAIEVAVGIYEGVGLNKVGNTTIAGHNYRNGTFFSDNKKIEIGDKIYITDESGTKVTYKVYNTVTVAPEDSSYFGRDTQGAREITLDTCTDDAQSRILVLAKEE